MQEEPEIGETTGLTDRLAKRQRRAWEEGSGSEDDSEKEAERKLLKDQQEKEDFEARLKARDEAKTRKIAEARLSKEEVQVGHAGTCCVAAIVAVRSYGPNFARHAGQLHSLAA